MKTHEIHGFNSQITRCVISAYSSSTELILIAGG